MLLSKGEFGSYTLLSALHLGVASHLDGLAFLHHNSHLSVFSSAVQSPLVLSPDSVVVCVP